MNSNLSIAIDALNTGQPLVVRTETLYGIIALASNKAAVKAVYEAKARNPMKQCIVLVASPSNVGEYGNLVAKYSDGHLPTSVIVPATSEPDWLLCGGKTVAYRITRDPFLAKLIASTGPVIAPSANPEGQPPARTVAQARDYFSDGVVYIDGGEVPASVQASRIIEVLPNGNVREVRH